MRAKAVSTLVALALMTLTLALALLAGASAAVAQTFGPGPAVCQNLGNLVGPPPPAWPSPLEQLAGDRIQPGSALAQLVLANQDFKLLDPAESRDGKPFPPWLRVLWKKAHPGTRYLKNDPAGGYPSVLTALHRWMLHHQDLQASPPPPAQAPRAAASVSGQQRISGLQSMPVENSDVRVNPAAPSQLLVAADDPEGVVGQLQIFYSTDGGASWGRSSLPLSRGQFQAAEGAVEWTSDGTAWATAVTTTIINEHWAYFQLLAYRSSDQGQTWTFDALLSGNLAATHRERLWVDRGAGSPFRDNVYVAWNDLDAVYFARRTHGDGVWHNAIQVSDAQTLLSTAGAEVETNAAGAVFVFWVDSLGQKLFVAKSTDGGASFATPVAIASIFNPFQLWMPAVNATTPVHANGGAYRSGMVDQVYAVWADLSGDAGCTLWTEQPIFVAGGNSCKSRVWFARSADGGATWSPPVKIDDRPTLDDQFAPVLAVDEASGKLSVTYYDTIGDATRRTTNLFYQSSADGGTTWNDPFQVTTVRTDETILGADPSQYGVHNGLSVVGGFIVPTWTDRRNGNFEEIWSAALSDPDPCSAPAATGLQAIVRPAGVDLTWDAVPGATYRVFRAAASGGPYGLIATPTVNGYFDAAGGCGVTSYYVVRAVTGCASALSAEVSVTNRPTSVLYQNDFESGAGVADWTTQSVPGFGGAADWRGIQACTAHGGSGIFRFGGPTCGGSAGLGDIAFAYPQGPDGIPIPAGSSGLQLSFWHRRDFQPGSGGFLGFSYSDILNGCWLVGPQDLSGDGYSGFIRSACATPTLLFQPIFTGTASSFTQTTVDLDRAFGNDAALVGGPQGHVLEPLFLAFTDCGGAASTGWFLDDVTVTTCTAAPAPAYGFFTLPPCRLLDTRQAPGPGGGPALGPGEARAVTLAGRCGVPPNAKALSLNVTVVQPAQTGSLLLSPDDQPLPTASTISFRSGVVRANNAIVGLGNGTGGAVVQNQSAGGLDLLIDVNGYFE